MAKRRLSKPTKEYRKHIPIGVKLHACLLLLGFTEEQIKGGLNWDHAPALSLRFEDPETGELTPHPNDPRYIQPLAKDGHDVKTYGPGGEKRIHTRGSDISEPIRIDAIAEKHQAFRERLMKPARAKIEKPKAKRAWPSRPFNAKGKRK